MSSQWLPRFIKLRPSSEIEIVIDVLETARDMTCSMDF